MRSRRWPRWRRSSGARPPRESVSARCGRWRSQARAWRCASAISRALISPAISARHAWPRALPPTRREVEPFMRLDEIDIEPAAARREGDAEIEIGVDIAARAHRRCGSRPGNPRTSDCVPWSCPLIRRSVRVRSIRQGQAVKEMVNAQRHGQSRRHREIVDQPRAADPRRGEQPRLAVEHRRAARAWRHRTARHNRSGRSRRATSRRAGRVERGGDIAAAPRSPPPLRPARAAGRAAAARSCGIEIGVARGQGEAVIVALGGTPTISMREIEIGGHPADDRELLEILFAEQARRRAATWLNSLATTVATPSKWPGRAAPSSPSLTPPTGSCVAKPAGYISADVGRPQQIARRPRRAAWRRSPRGADRRRDPRSGRTGSG